MLKTRVTQELLSKVEVVLASKSPRRKEILAGLLGNDNFQIVPSNFEEDLDKSSFDGPAGYVNQTAKEKAVEVRDRLADVPVSDGKSRRLIISADTIVVLNDQILEKPRDREHAFEMLSSLSGRTHEVITAITLCLDDKVEPFYEVTKVKFGDLAPEMIQSYIDTNEPMDKAGGYGIQAIGGSFISEISGCYYNVVGFPQHLFCCKLLELLEKGTTNDKSNNGGEEEKEEENSTAVKKAKICHGEK
mmetsp:Transcript_20079/g.32465  ORF Transcript_20079/g.32465 Transcript_20079/m.32465 type:complete len:246 (-) Transcript_20079:196-933(-)